jgi:protein gp37
MNNTAIVWTDLTWNPVRGCDKVAPGCKNCYASTFAERFRGVPGHPFEQGFDLRLAPHKLEEPLRLRKPSMIFVNSTSDLFHRDVPESYIRQVCDVMMQAPRHTFQVLTKRSERMRDLLNSVAFRDVAMAEHIWWGVSCENRKHGLPRIEHLRQANVAHRFVSAEPLLEDLGAVDLCGIHWLIVGGESGRSARPFDVAWAENLQRQCAEQGTAFFAKQLGAKPVLNDEPLVILNAKGRRDGHAGDPSRWPQQLAGLGMRQSPAAVTRQEVVA